MMDIYVGRQAILNIAKETVGYELLYRSNSINVFQGDVGDMEASIQVINNVFSELGLQEISSGLPVFINFNRDMLLADLPDLNSTSVVVEILEDILVDQPVIEACIRFRKNGFKIALDDFVPNENTCKLLSLASIVKIDWRATPIEQINAICQELQPYRMKLLAEKIETEQEFREAKDLGFHFFQGFFFERPTILKTTALQVLSNSIVEIMELIQDEDMEFEKLEKVIAKDAALSFKLLKIINSASKALFKRIESINQALILLGQKELKRWLTLFVLTQVNSKYPAELMSIAFIRGLFGEKMAVAAGRASEASAVFFTGLLSLLDAMLRRPMAEVVKGLPLSKTIKDALIHNKGPIGTYLLMIKAYERAEKEKIKHYGAILGIETGKVVRCYIDSLRESGVYLQSLT